MQHQELREEIVIVAQAFNTMGLSVGTSGNLSALIDGGFLITPTGVVYKDLKPEDVVELDTEGIAVSGLLRPSSEWRFHRDIYLARIEVNAIVHIHSPYATAIACTRQAIPPVHYMIAIAGGDSIRCAEYATFATEQLSKNALKALKDRKACLLANHGLIALGETIQDAFRIAQEVEELAKQYYLSKQVGEPVLLDEEEMEMNIEKFKTYGKQDDN